MEPTFTPIGGGDSFTLDTLRISNFTQEGPTKTAKGGLNAEVVMRFGKTARLEMEDVIGRIAVLRGLMGVENVSTTLVEDFVDTFYGDGSNKKFILSHAPSTIVSATVDGSPATYAYDGNILIFDTAPDLNEPVIITYDYQAAESIAVTEKFAGMFEIKGKTFVVNQSTGNREYIEITVHKFLPDSLLNVTMEAEGDFGVMNIAGELFTNDCGVFYTIGQEDSPC
jgi:hypothetical protein